MAIVKNGSGRLIGLLADRHFALLHRLQQRGLRLRRRAVDFVGQQDVREHRPFDEAEIPLAVLVFFEHVRARDVRRHQVGRELNAFEIDVQNSAPSVLTIKVFAKPGTPTKQAMPAREDGGEDLLDDLVLADDHLLQFFLHQLPMLAELLQHIAQAARFYCGHAKVPF